MHGFSSANRGQFLIGNFQNLSRLFLNEHSDSRVVVHRAPLSLAFGSRISNKEDRSLCF